MPNPVLMEGSEALGQKANLSGSSSQQEAEIARLAGTTLVDLASKNSNGGRKELFDYEVKLLEESFQFGPRWERFPFFHVKALRTALKGRYYNMVHRLLAKDHARDLLNSENDILQVAISAHCVGSRIEEESTYLKSLIESLIRHGAKVNTFDKNGLTPLYYCCTYGLSQAFEVLRQSGGNVWTLHDQVPNGDIDDILSSRQSLRPTKVNLLQIALDSRLYSEQGAPIPALWSRTLEKKWGPIIMSLLDTGMKVSPRDPGLVKVMSLACLNAQEQYIVKLLDVGVDIEARAGRSDENDHVLPTALYAAAVKGHSSVVRNLLNHGANVNLKETVKFYSKPALLTPTAALCKFSAGSSDTNFAATCDVLLQQALSEDDLKLILAEAARRACPKLLTKLLNDGIRIDTIPVCEDLVCVKILRDHGTSYCSADLQRHAVARGLLDMLNFLVNCDGPLLPLEDFGDITDDIVRSSRDSMLVYLVTDYGFDVNKTFPASRGATEHINLLQQAYNRRNISAVRILLDHGADYLCPGLPDTALSFFRKSFNGMNGRIDRYLDLLHLALRYENQQVVLQQRTKDRLSRCEKASSERSSLDFDTMQVQDLSLGLNQMPPNHSSYFPTNTMLAGSYCYQALVGLKTIRLVELLPSILSKNAIRCQVSTWDLSGRPNYEALSYVWGPRDCTVTISLDDHPFEVTSNLWAALNKLRRQDESVFLWVDAICINQSDLEERSRQVELMRDIYQVAESVNVWLGYGSEDSHLVFEHLSREINSNDTYFDISPYDETTLKAFRNLCRQAWFWRTWVIQEVILAKEATVHCGQYSAPWAAFSRSARSQDADLFHHPLDGIDGPSRLYQLKRIQENPSFDGVSVYSRLCDASDPRDKVYGILGLFDRQVIPVDYKLGVCDVYYNFTRAVIQQTHSLQVLHWVGVARNRDDLASWVPDFSISKPLGVLPGIFDTDTAGNAYPVRTMPGLYFKGPLLITKGKRLDTIKAVSTTLVADQSFRRGTEKFSQVLEQWERLATGLTTKRFSQSISHAFLETIVANDIDFSPSFGPDGESSDFSTKFLTWYEMYGTGILQAADTRYFEDLEIVRCWPDKFLSVGRLEEDIAKYAQKMEVVCYGRQFFVTDSGSMGLCSPQAQAGDVLVYLAGGFFPFVLRDLNGGIFEMKGDCFLYDCDPSYMFSDGDRSVEEFTLR